MSATTAMRVNTVMPSDSALTSATRSAHSVSPYVAFSMLQPVIDPPVVGLERRAHLEAGIECLRVAARVDGRGEQRLFRLEVGQQRHARSEPAASRAPFGDRCRLRRGRTRRSRVSRRSPPPARHRPYGDASSASGRSPTAALVYARRSPAQRPGFRRLESLNDALEKAGELALVRAARPPSPRRARAASAGLQPPGS